MALINEGRLVRIRPVVKEDLEIFATWSMSSEALGGFNAPNIASLEQYNKNLAEKGFITSDFTIFAIAIPVGVRWLFLLLCLLLVGCTTAKYRVLNSGEYGTELTVSPDLILLECEWIHDADTKDSYGFMMHVLDEENTVLTLVQGNTLDKGSCDRRIKRIGEILRKGKSIYIAGTGDLSESRQNGTVYLFPAKGAFSSNGRVLGFAAIANEFGSCYDAYSGDEEPCPRNPFPLQK